jgi:hypothetical protein
MLQHSLCNVCVREIRKYVEAEVEVMKAVTFGGAPKLIKRVNFGEGFFLSKGALGYEHSGCQRKM